MTTRKICSIEGCDREYRARGWCKKHHEQWLKTGDPLFRTPKTECVQDGCTELVHWNSKLKMCEPHARPYYHIKTVYGIPHEEFDKLLAKQENKCGICKEILDPPNVDHCHETGDVRGLLCYSCNIGLGFFKDNAELLIQAIKWITEGGSYNQM